MENENLLLTVVAIVSIVGIISMTMMSASNVRERAVYSVKSDTTPPPFILPKPNIAVPSGDTAAGDLSGGVTQRGCWDDMFRMCVAGYGWEFYDICMSSAGFWCVETYELSPRVPQYGDLA